MKENMEMHGAVRLILTDRDGRTVIDNCYKNRIVKSGRLLVAQLFGGITIGKPPVKISHIGLGSGDQKVTDSQTDLVAQRLRKPITEVSYSDVNETMLEGKVERVKVSLRTVFDFAEANDKEPLCEAAIFNDATGGVMYNRVVFPPVTKTDAFRLTLMWDVVF